MAIKLTFKKTVDTDPNYPGRKYQDIYWLSDCGGYKVKEYFDSPEGPGRAVYAAYYKPSWLNNFGNHVDPSIKFYDSPKAAMKDCEKHINSIKA